MTSYHQGKKRACLLHTERFFTPNIHSEIQKAKKPIISTLLQPTASLRSRKDDAIPLSTPVSFFDPYRPSFCAHKWRHSNPQSFSRSLSLYFSPCSVLLWRNTVKRPTGTSVTRETPSNLTGTSATPGSKSY
uniref:Uncharacterized protein n=1 Tax=Hyaloperonospora arabidopsidis (strain Emoy2) TaxID=559515 RepID=M4BQ86_HYAAE